MLITIHMTIHITIHITIFKLLNLIYANYYFNNSKLTINILLL